MLPTLYNEELDLTFEWNESRTVNIFRGKSTEPKDNIDVFSFGYGKQETPTYEEFKAHVEEWINTRD